MSTDAPLARGGRVLVALALAVGLAGGCADRDGSQAPTDPGQPPPPPVNRQAATMEHIAQGLAQALQDPGARAFLRTELERSRFREHKLPLQQFLAGRGRRLLDAMARATGTTVVAVEAELLGAPALEVYLPVPEHRRTWRGEDLLVATAINDRDAPVAFDGSGRRRVLSARTAPTTPVLGLVPVETDFEHPILKAGEVCPLADLQCDGDGSGGGTGGGGTGGPALSSAPGLHMLQTQFAQTFESWLKGSPEFEVHVMGQSGSGQELESYQCAGEHAGGPYVFDQNGTTWTGDVLLFSQAQFDSYRGAHPGQAVRLLILEDDDGACKVKMDKDRFKNFVSALNAVYKAYTAGRDSVFNANKIFAAAPSILNLLKVAWSLITTQDDLVGNPVEDRIAGVYQPGMTHIVKGENGVTNGWIKLQMK